MHHEGEDFGVGHQWDIGVVESDGIAKAVVEAGGIALAISLQVAVDEPIARRYQLGDRRVVEYIANDQIALLVELADLFSGDGSVF